MRANSSGLRQDDSMISAIASASRLVLYITLLSSTLLCIEVPQSCVEDDDNLAHEGSDGDDALLSILYKALIHIT